MRFVFLNFMNSPIVAKKKAMAQKANRNSQHASEESSPKGRALISAFGAAKKAPCPAPYGLSLKCAVSPVPSIVLKAYFSNSHSSLTMLALSHIDLEDFSQHFAPTRVFDVTSFSACVFDGPAFIFLWFKNYLTATR